MSSGSTTGWGNMTEPPNSKGYLDKHTNNVQFTELVNMIDYLSGVAVSKIASIRGKKSAMSIADMFDLQMSMNKLSQFSEMSTAVVQSVNQSMGSASRGIKGG